MSMNSESKKQITGSVPIGLYVEDAHHQYPLKRLDDTAYADALAALVIVCTDALIIERATKTIFLAKRKVHPAPTWWPIGGRSRLGEVPEQSVARCFERETTLALSTARFSFVRINRYLFKDRKQAPTEMGTDTLAYIFVVGLTEAERAIANSSLDPNEYDTTTGLAAFDRNRLVDERAFPMLLDLYDQLFG